MTQQGLFDAVAPGLDRDFRDFHRNNPEVYSTLRRLAQKALDNGHQKIGIKMLWEVMRWELMLETKDRSSFVLNNNYTSRYARLLMRQEPQFRGVFETRKLST